MKFGQIKPNLGVPINWSNPLSKGLVGCWLMNEGGGNIIADLSGNGRNGSVVNALWSPGKYGTTLAFDDSGDYVDLGRASWVDYLPEISIVASVKNNNVSKVGTNDYIVDKWTNWNCFYLAWDATEKFHFEVRTNTAGGVSVQSSVRDGTIQHHLAGTYDGANIRLYVNGELDGGPKAQTGTVRSAVNNLYISSSVNSATTSWDGIIDYVFIYNRALSASEIAELYRNPFGIFQPTFSVWWYSGIGGEPPATSIPIFMYHYLNH